MQRHLSLLLATLFVLAGVVGFPVVYYLWYVQQPIVIERRLDPEMLYALGIPGVIIELEKDSSVRALDGTVLALDRQDLNLLLQSTFSEEDVARKALEVHQSIIDNVVTGPRDTFTFSISTTAERPLVQKNLVRIYRRKMVARPECSMGDFLGIAWRGMGKLFGARQLSDEAQLRRLPHCRPPRMVQDGVMNAVVARLEAAQRTGADSVRVVPAFGPKAHRFIRRSLQLGQTGPFILWVFPGLLAVIVVLSSRDRAACYARLATPLLITGLLLVLIHVPLLLYARDMDFMATIHKIDADFRMSESTAQWLQVVFYVVKTTGVAAARNVTLVGAFLVLLGLLFARQHQRCRITAPGEEKLTPIPAAD